MKRLLLLLLFSLSVGLCFSQKTELKIYTAFDNYKFAQNDSIYFGYPSGDFDRYEYIKEYYYNSLDNQGYRVIKGNLWGTKHKILNIYKDDEGVWDKNSYIIEVGAKGFLKGYKLYINIDKAITEGEVILSQKPHKNTNEDIEEFSDSIAFLFKVKKSAKPIKDFALEYLLRYNNETYVKYKHDEFELDNQKAIATEKITDLIAQINDTITYFIDLELNLDNYDFSTLSFPVGYKDSYTVIKLVILEYPETRLVFINQKEFSTLHIDKAIANSFIKRRKNIFGEINRKIYARIYFKNSEISTDTLNRSYYSENNYLNFLGGDIQKIEFFDFPNMNYNYIGKISSYE